MININEEQLLSLPEASKTLPGNPCPSTMHRWRLVGIAGIKLETVKIGHRRYTSREALNRFIFETTKATESKPVSLKPTRLSRSAQKTKRLKKAGLIKK